MEAVTAPSPNPTPAQATAPVATPGASAAPPAAQPSDPQPKAEITRPEGIPDEYWDAEKGVKHADMLARLNELSAFKAERDSMTAQVPENADGYEPVLPKDFALPESIKVPEGFEIKIDADDPRVQMAREFAHSMGMNQEGFSKLLAMGVNADAAAEMQFQERIAKEAEALGSRSKERINAVTDWLHAKLGDELGKSLSDVLVKADQVKAFEALMGIARKDPPGVPGGGRDTKPIELSDEEYSKLSPAEQINYSRKLAQQKAAASNRR